MYHIQKHLSYEKGLLTVKDLQVGKWYSDLYGDGYADVVLTRKEKDNSLTILHGWIYPNEEKGGYDFCFSESRSSSDIYVLRLAPELIDYHPDFSGCDWENLLIQSIYNELYLDLNDEYGMEALPLPDKAKDFLVQYSIDKDVLEKDYITSEVFEELLKRY